MKRIKLLAATVVAACVTLSVATTAPAATKKAASKRAGTLTVVSLAPVKSFSAAESERREERRALLAAGTI